MLCGKLLQPKEADPKARVCSRSSVTNKTHSPRAWVTWSRLLTLAPAKGLWAAVLTAPVPTASSVVTGYCSPLSAACFHHLAVSDLVLEFQIVPSSPSLWLSFALVEFPPCHFA